ncbi:oxygenase MpaB family protein [Christiangramia sp.]|uniref:oxygenase MpaB family protein n=1 Tax=Christiangramia sp. TaxID=1931228 RepID=UPI00261E8A04|nr:oxygenase MpaB family protein [Christiangramia sp.]
MEYFVRENSIVREIWGKGDTILFIFAGASAEFALNKAVDWLFYTGKLPQDPLGRLFSTVSYARKIVFSEKQAAIKAIENINTIHNSVETSRGRNIPDWAYRDVLLMLIDYSIRSYEILERTLSLAEKREVFQVFYRLGKRMRIKDLPQSFEQFQRMRKNHLEQHLHYGNFSEALYKRYRQQLGWFRYRLLIETQILITPKKVRQLLLFRSFSLLHPVILIYKIIRIMKLDWLLKSLVLPSAYQEEIRSMDRAPA